MIAFGRVESIGDGIASQMTCDSGQWWQTVHGQRWHGKQWQCQLSQRERSNTEMKKSIPVHLGHFSNPQSTLVRQMDVDGGTEDPKLNL